MGEFESLEGKVSGITVATIALKESNGIMGPGHRSWITGAVPQYGIKVMEEGKDKGTEVYFNAYNNLQRGAFVKVEYEMREGKRMARQIDVVENGEVVERYIRNYKDSKMQDDD